MPKAVETLSVSQIQALAEAEAERWNRQGRLAAWIIAWLPAFLGHAVTLGIGAAFSDKAELPDLPDWDKLLHTLPDYMSERSDG